MQHMSRWGAAVAALCLTTACSESPRSPTAPNVSAAIVMDLGTLEACTNELQTLRVAIADADFSGRKDETDRANLLAKLNAAEAKLAEGNPADAIQKLEDIRATVIALSTAPKPKIDAGDASAIIAAIDAAATCIRAEATSSASTLLTGPR